MKNNLSSVPNVLSQIENALLYNISGHDLITVIGIAGAFIFGGICIVCVTGSEFSVDNGAISLRGRVQP
ncbi:MAG: hypothetical protein LIO78_09015 [Clostridiales bacterium]|nr:hypothetical protein [Clostridiales bacterium]